MIVAGDSDVSYETIFTESNDDFLSSYEIVNIINPLESANSLVPLDAEDLSSPAHSRTYDRTVSGVETRIEEKAESDDGSTGFLIFSAMLLIVMIIFGFTFYRMKYTLKI